MLKIEKVFNNNSLITYYNIIGGLSVVYWGPIENKNLFLPELENNNTLIISTIFEWQINSFFVKVIDRLNILTYYSPNQ